MNSTPQEMYHGKPIEEMGEQEIHLDVDGTRFKTTLPADQIWLYHMLDEQTRILASIRSAVWVIGIIVILVVLFAGCSGVHL